MYGSGSAILINYNETFFLLTAKHVIHNNIKNEFQNESPFWASVSHRAKWDSMHDFLMPRVIWNIGELISEDFDSVDTTDICLIEMFNPPKYHRPDHYIKIDNKKSVLLSHDFFEGQLLLASGYPFEKNAFNFTPISEKFTHSTNLTRQTYVGSLVKSNEQMHISFDFTKADVQHKNITGMSGGTICNVQPKSNQVKLAGLPLTAGDNICRFIPSYIFIDAILEYKKSSYTVVDPIVDTPASFEDTAKCTLDYLLKYDPEFKKKIF